MSEVGEEPVGTGENVVGRRPGIIGGQGHPRISMPKLDIPMFDGNAPRWWIRRCERAFEWYGVPKQQRVTLVATYLNDAGDYWYQGWSKVKEECH